MQAGGKTQTKAKQASYKTLSVKIAAEAKEEGINKAVVPILGKRGDMTQLVEELGIRIKENLEELEKTHGTLEPGKLRLADKLVQVKK